MICSNVNGLHEYATTHVSGLWMAGLTCDCFHGGKIEEFSLVKPNKGPGIIKCCSKVIMGVINCVDIWRSNFLRHTVQGENFAPVGN